MSIISLGNVLIINVYQYYLFLEGKLNVVFVDKVVILFEGKGYNICVVMMVEEYDVDEQFVYY